MLRYILYRSIERCAQSFVHSTCRLLQRRKLHRVTWDGGERNTTGDRRPHTRLPAQLREQGILPFLDRVSALPPARPCLPVSPCLPILRVRIIIIIIKVCLTICWMRRKRRRRIFLYIYSYIDAVYYTMFTFLSLLFSLQITGGKGIQWLSRNWSNSYKELSIDCL